MVVISCAHNDQVCVRATSQSTYTRSPLRRRDRASRKASTTAGKLWPDLADAATTYVRLLRLARCSLLFLYGTLWTIPLSSELYSLLPVPLLLLAPHLSSAVGRRTCAVPELLLDCPFERRSLELRSLRLYSSTWRNGNYAKTVVLLV